MNTDRLILAIAGAIVLISLVLGRYVHPYWFAVTAWMGADLLQASVTGYCPLAWLLRIIGVRSGPAFR